MNYPELIKQNQIILELLINTKANVDALAGEILSSKMASNNISADEVIKRYKTNVQLCREALLAQIKAHHYLEDNIDDILKNALGDDGH